MKVRAVYYTKEKGAARTELNPDGGDTFMHVEFVTDEGERIEISLEEEGIKVRATGLRAYGLLIRPYISNVITIDFDK